MEEQKVRLITYNNGHYRPGAGAFKRTLWYFVNVLFFINPLNPLSSLKVLLLRAFGARVGKRVTIKPAMNIKHPWLLWVGDDVWIGEKVWIDNLVRVTIEDNCTLSQGAMLLTGSHDYKKASFDLLVGEIVLREGCWIGAQSMVALNVTCGTHSVLAAGSVATSDLEPYMIYQGNPAMPKRRRQVL